MERLDQKVSAAQKNDRNTDEKNEWHVVSSFSVNLKGKTSLTCERFRSLFRERV
jgi:hypothetical protein